MSKTDNPQKTEFAKLTALQKAVNDFLMTKDPMLLIGLASDMAPCKLICQIEAHGSKLDVFHLNLPLMVYLLLGSRAEPTFMQTAGMYKYPGFELPENLLMTKVTSSTGHVFDISNQFEHSWVCLTQRRGVAGFHLINAVKEKSYLYGRLMCVHHNFSGSLLSMGLLGLMAEDAIAHGFEYVKHKVANNNFMMINLMKRLGHKDFVVDSGAPDFLIVQTPARIVFQQAQRYGYEKVGL